MPKYIWSLPNLLTYARILAVPALVLCYALSADFNVDFLARLVTWVVFVVASLTDFLDGYLARKWNQTSAMGKMLDPLADKFLVAVALLILCADGTLSGWHLFAPCIIFGREFLVAGIREIVGQASGALSVTSLAKWKTTIQMVALALLILGEPFTPLFVDVGLIALWIAALLTVITGWDYFKKALPIVAGQS